LEIGGHRVPRYQIYVLGIGDEIEDVAAVIACDNDQEAIRKVRLLVDSHEIELWAGSRIVHRLHPARPTAPPANRSVLQVEHGLVAADSWRLKARPTDEAVVDQPLATTGPFPIGALPIGALPIGALPIGALPTTGVGGGGCWVGISAAIAALAKARLEVATITKCFMTEAPRSLRKAFSIDTVTLPLTV
jgi:hypothetical protein